MRTDLKLKLKMCFTSISLIYLLTALQVSATVGVVTKPEEIPYAVGIEFCTTVPERSCRRSKQIVTNGRRSTALTLTDQVPFMLEMVPPAPAKFDWSTIELNVTQLFKDVKGNLTEKSVKCEPLNSTDIVNVLSSNKVKQEGGLVFILASAQSTVTVTGSGTGTECKFALPAGSNAFEIPGTH